MVAGKRLALRLDRLDLAEGFRKIVSGVRLFAVARALFGAAIVAWLAFRALEGHLVDFVHLPGRLAWAGPALAEIAHTLARDAALAGVAIGALDLLVVRRAWTRRLRMTKDEVRREHKETEGDPHVKAARQRAHQEILAGAGIASVRDATLLVVSPAHVATALRYEEEDGDRAPVVVARGEGDLAQNMIRAAEEYGVPVVRDVPLALAELEVGDAIPEALYEAVAEILRDAWEAEENTK